MAKIKQARLPLSEVERFARGLPTEGREQHGTFDKITGAVPDARDGYGWPIRRAVDCLEVMGRRRTITGTMRAAGQRFREDFEQAHLEPLRSSDPRSVKVQMTRSTDSRGNPASDRIWDALQLLGGLNSPAGSCAWHVLGEQQTLKDWAELRGFARNPHVATGILIGTLGALESHYDLVGKIHSR